MACISSKSKWALAGLAELVVVLAALGVQNQPARGENWPGFRGPTGQGITTEKDLPREWSDKSPNVQWKVPLPPHATKGQADSNQSSPIVWNDRIYATTAYWPSGAKKNDFPEQHVTCYQLADGKQIWDVTVPNGPWKLSDLRGGYCASTPATDGKRVYVVFGSAIIAALDLEGKLIWKQELKDTKQFDVCFATSPVVDGNTVLLNCGRNNKASTLTAYDAATGDVRWETKRPTVSFDHTTPLLTKVGGRKQLLIAASNELQGIDPESGEVIWSAHTAGDVPTPVYDGTLVYTDSGRGSPGIAVDPNGTGDLTKTNVKWKISQIPEALGSAAISGKYLLRLHNPAILKCFDFTTGKELFSSRLEGATTQASPIVTPDGTVYFASAGKTFVIKPGDALDLLATNDLHDNSNASAAVAPGRLIFKGSNYLWCVGGKSERAAKTEKSGESQK